MNMYRLQAVQPMNRGTTPDRDKKRSTWNWQIWVLCFFFCDFTHRRMVAFVPKFRDNLSAPSSRFKGTNRLPWNVGKKLSFYTAWNRQRTQISFTRRQELEITIQKICLCEIANVSSKLSLPKTTDGTQRAKGLWNSALDRASFADTNVMENFIVMCTSVCRLMSVV
jgi:hypothetical protein